MTHIAHTPENESKILQVVGILEGSSMGLDDGLQQVFGEDATAEDFALELLELLDEHVMLCEECAWWCPTADLDDDQVCNTCR